MCILSFQQLLLRVIWPETLNGDQFTLSTQSIKTNDMYYPVLPLPAPPPAPTTHHPGFSRNLPLSLIFQSVAL